MRLLTIAEAANRLGLRPATLRHWVWQRQIAIVKIGRCIRIQEAVIQDLIAKGTRPAKR
jgi:excisionase family DNA binding protein